MLTGRQPCLKVATLDNSSDGPAVDLKIESQIPTIVCRPENDQAPNGLSGSGSERDRANEKENQDETAGGSVF